MESNLVQRLNFLCERELIEIIDEKIILTAKGKNLKEAGELKEEDSYLKVPSDFHPDQEKIKTKITLILLKIKDSVFRKKHP